MKEGVCVSKNIEQEIVSEAERQAEEIRETQAKPKDKFKTTVQMIMDTIPEGHQTERYIRVYVYAFFWKRRRLLPDGAQINKYVRTINAYIGGGQRIIDMIREDMWTDANGLTDPELQETMEQIFLYETE